MLYERIKKELESLQEQGAKRQLIPLRHHGMYLDRGDADLLNMASNDYLGLSVREDLAEAFWSELTDRGYPRASADIRRFGSGSSRLLTGNYPVIEELESLLASLFHREAALVFNSGYHLNTAVLPALCDASTLVVADKLVHASIIDGIRLSRAAFDRFKHNDWVALERILDRKATSFDAVIIVVESVYSMDGDCADLRSLVALKKRYPNVLLYVDEAHAIGVCGACGLGLAEETDTIADIDLLCGTFGKAIGGMGGYIVCDGVVRDYLINRARPLIYSTALPPLIYAWVLFVFKRLASFAPERQALHAISSFLRERVWALGYPMPSTSHIVPIVLGSNEASLALSALCADAGYYVPAVRPPTVPVGSSRLRVSLSAALRYDEVERFADLLRPVCED